MTSSARPELAREVKAGAWVRQASAFYGFRTLPPRLGQPRLDHHRIFDAIAKNVRFQAFDPRKIINDFIDRSAGDRVVGAFQALLEHGSAVCIDEREAHRDFGLHSERNRGEALERAVVSSLEVQGLLSHRARDQDERVVRGLSDAYEK